MKDKIGELPKSSRDRPTIDICTGKNNFKRTYEPGTKFVKNQNIEKIRQAHISRDRYQNTGQSHKLKAICVEVQIFGNNDVN
jgi:hypothetical protein